MLVFCSCRVARRLAGDRNELESHHILDALHLFIVLIAFLLRLAVITIGHTYRITPRRDHFQFGWEMGRIARSIALGQGFSSPTDLPTGPSAWAPPVYPYILAGVFKLFGIYSNLSAWVILTFNSIFSALTCLTLYRIAEKIYGVCGGPGHSLDVGAVPLRDLLAGASGLGDESQRIPAKPCAPAYPAHGRCAAAPAHLDRHSDFCGGCWR